MRYVLRVLGSSSVYPDLALKSNLEVLYILSLAHCYVNSECSKLFYLSTLLAVELKEVVYMVLWWMHIIDSVCARSVLSNSFY
jgi:hypothetical protein